MNTVKKSSVDILCPIYNGERFLDQLMNCLLGQSYDNITLIMIDDGSTDDTYKILENYRSQVECRGYGYIILKQDNKGQAGAYSTGLTKSKGDYVFQIDCDDLIVENAIEKFVDALDHRPQAGFVRANGWEHYLEDRNRRDVLFTDMPIYDIRDQKQAKICEMIISGKIYLASCSLMYRQECFRKIYPDGKIDSTREGQNLQIILPLAYRYEGIYIEEPLFWYIIRNDSHSHSRNSKENELFRIKETVRIMTVSLKQAKAPDEFIEKNTKEYEYRSLLNCAFKYNDPVIADGSYAFLRENKLDTYNDWKNYVSIKYPFVRKCRNLFVTVHKKVKRRG